MISPKIEEQEKLMIDRIEKSELDVDDKTQLIEQLKCSKEACNGYTQEEKIQAISENQFATSVILAKIMIMLKTDRAANWKDVAIKALHSWHLVLITAILSILLFFHPEIAQILVSLAN